MKKWFFVVLVLMSWGFVKGQEVPEYRIDSIKKEKIMYGKEFENDKDSIKYSVSYTLPKIISNDKSYFDSINKKIKDYYHYVESDGEFKTTFKISRKSKNILSLIIENYTNWFVIGGHFSGITKQGFSFDLVNKSQISLKEIIKKEKWNEADSLLFKLSEGINSENKFDISISKGYNSFSIQANQIDIYYNIDLGAHCTPGIISISFEQYKDWFNEYFWELINEK